ncbi:hypothetical protein D020_0294B, partial [Vibrio parahaemolyticus SBR10290]
NNSTCFFRTIYHVRHLLAIKVTSRN